MAYLYTLQLTGIEGESEISEHEKEINIDEIIQEYEAPSEMDKITLLDKTDIRPAVNCHGITITKTYDKSTPNILSSLTEGSVIEEGLISCFGSSSEVFLTIGMKRLIVRKVKLSFSKENASVLINFSYEEIDHNYVPDGAKKAIFNYRRDIP